VASCDYCGKDISIEAKRCPNCGETGKTLTLKERQTEWSDNFWKELALSCLVAAVIWLFGIIIIAVSDLSSVPGLANFWVNYSLWLAPFFIYYKMRKPRE
jgi:uncharacterized membrane protein YvbJ